MNTLSIKACLVALTIAFSLPTSAATVSSLSDDFNSLSTNLNYNSFSNWDVVNGTVDAIQQGNQWGINCFGNTGGCVDLDGSTSNAGDMISKDGFFAGTYTLVFSLSGNQRQHRPDSLVVSLGSYSENFILNAGAVWGTFTRVVTVAADGSKLSFSHAGGDNVGIMLDNVSVSAVPIPAAAFMFAPALLGFLGLRRRAKNTSI